MAPRIPALVFAPFSLIELSLANSFNAARVHFGLGVLEGAVVALRREFERERERRRRTGAFTATLGFDGEGERARAGDREAALFGEDFFDDDFVGELFLSGAFFGLALRGVLLAEAPGCGSGELARAGDLAASLLACGERGTALLGDWEESLKSASLSGVVGFAPTAFSRDARCFGDIGGDFFGFADAFRDVDDLCHAESAIAATFSSFSLPSSSNKRCSGCGKSSSSTSHFVQI
ncbi:hypothetical protein, conserved [Leishmania tarentolae]|uniref:Uncharacterized protein n=1 Tax=Leishmania tarentolae TaxID=5689 RepID=A0A640KMK3_LEITA|nr:hypothetical protein, conserved [Leishmania tarentolae]